MKKIFGLVAMIAMLAAMAVPAAAHTNDVGAFVGEALVSQNNDTCGVGAPGLGLPIIHGDNKVGSWRLVTTTVASVNHGLGGTLDVCGKLNPVLGIGAACGMSKGYSGDGTLTAGTLVSTISDAGWKVSLGGTLLVIGKVTGHNAGGLVTVAQAQGGAPCRDKAATLFNVAAVFVAGAGIPDSWNAFTDRCDTKANGAGGQCGLDLWGPKKS